MCQIVGCLFLHDIDRGLNPLKLSLIIESSSRRVSRVHGPEEFLEKFLERLVDL